MKSARILGYGILFSVFFMAGNVMAQESSQEAYQLNSVRIETALNALSEKKIQPSSDFLMLLEANKRAIADTVVPIQLKTEFQLRLLSFIENATNAENYKNGKYSSLLRYNIFLIQWKTQNKLYENVIQYPLLSIKGLRLFAQDSVGYAFLDSMAHLYPEEILRNADAFITQPYAPRIIAKISEVAPEMVKRYFTATSPIKEVALTDTSAVLLAMQTIFQQLPLKTRAYFLLDPILKRKISLRQADSLTIGRDNLFSSFVNVLKEPKPLGLYSINRELEFIGIDIARGLSLKTEAAIVNYYQITEYSKEQIVAVLVYGYKEMYPIDFSNMLSILLRKGDQNIPNAFFENLSVARTAEFVRFLQKEDKLDVFIKIAGENNSLYLRSLYVYEKTPDDLTPDLVNIPLKPIPDKVEPVTRKEDPVTVARKEDPVTVARKEDLTLELAKINEKISTTPIDVPTPKIVAVEEVIEPEKFDYTDEQKMILIYKKNIYASLQNIPAFIDAPYAKDILFYAAEVEPDELFKKAEKFKGKYFFQELLERAALQAPVSAKKYLVNPYHLVSFILSQSENPVIKKMIEINTATGFKSKPYLLINDIAADNLSVEAAMTICNNQDRLFKELVKLVAKQNYIGQYSIEKEFSYYALRFIRDINDKIGQSDNSRFASLDNLSNEELYYATVYGREEVFNSTFTGIFARYEKSLQQMDEKSFRQFLSLPKLGTFIALCASNYKLTKLLSYFSPEQRNELLHRIIANLDASDKSFEDAVMISETIANTNSEEILSTIEQNIKAQYKNCDSLKEKECMAIYGILAGLCKDKAVYDPRWFKVMSKKYQASELTTLQFKTFDEAEKVIERMFFYDDADGQDSYQSFLASFRNASGWKVEELYSYVKVTSTSGKAIEIYANKPSYEESGEQVISKLFTYNGYKPAIIIHRGHSFHTERTLERIPPSTKLVFIGSCGGFYKASIAIKNAPEAHIIATRQIGTKQINDPIIFAINEAIRQQQDIQWPVFWEKMKGQLGNYSLFYDYVPPHKNIESLFQRAYYKTFGL